jgi:thiol-disulfide isomerase/thioredoxin
MTFLALILAAAAIVCGVMASRGMAVLLFAAAIGIWMVPGSDSGSSGGNGGLRGFEVASRPSAAPDAHFKSENGKQMSLEDFRGQVVLLNVWATWCGPCRSEMASLDRLQAKHGSDGLRVVAVSIDREGLPIVRRFYRERGLRNLQLYADSNRSTVSAFGVGPIPTTILIDREGNVVGEMIGSTRWDSPEAVELVGRYLAD